MRRLSNNSSVVMMALASTVLGMACTPSSSISLLSDELPESNRDQRSLGGSSSSLGSSGSAGAEGAEVISEEVSGTEESDGDGTVVASADDEDSVSIVVADLDGALSLGDDLIIQLRGNLVDELRERLGCDPRNCDPLRYLEVTIPEEILTEKFDQTIDQAMSVKVSVDEITDAIEANHSIIIRTPGPTFPKPESNQIQVYDLGYAVAGPISYAPVGVGEFAVLGQLVNGNYGAFVANTDKGVISSVVTMSVPIAQVTRIDADLAKSDSVLSGQSGRLLVGLASVSSSSVSSYQTLSTSSLSTSVSLVGSYSLSRISTLSTFSTFAVESYYISPSLGTSLLRGAF